MATKSKKSNTKWFQKTASKPLLGVVVIAIFSVAGAFYLNFSQASPILTAHPAGLTPGSSPGVQKPFTIKETVEDKKGQTIYRLPSSYIVNQNSSSWVSYPFSLNVSAGKMYRICASIRRVKDAPAERFQIRMSGAALATDIHNLAGSIKYKYLCTAWVPARIATPSSAVTGALANFAVVAAGPVTSVIFGTATNYSAKYALHVADITLERKTQPSY